MQDSFENTSDAIKEKIKETGIKQVHLAKKLGISPQHLNKIFARNQDKSQYLPKIAEILGISRTFGGLSNVKSIPLLNDNMLKSLSDGTVVFENLERAALKSGPPNIQEDYYFFYYELAENINSKLFKNDLLIFSTSLPCDMTGRVGITYIQHRALIFTGMLKYNQKKIMIYNEHDCFEFKMGDQLIGVAVHLERNIEKGLK